MTDKETQQAFLRRCATVSAETGTAIAAPGGAGAAALAKALHVPVQAVSRLVYDSSDGVRTPRTHQSLAEMASIVIANAENIGRDQVGDLLATGLGILLTTSGDAGLEGFLSGREPDYDTRTNHQPAGARLLGTGTCRVAATRKADGQIELVCMEDKPDLGLRKHDVFRGTTRPS